MEKTLQVQPIQDELTAGARSATASQQLFNKNKVQKHFCIYKNSVRKEEQKISHTMTTNPSLFSSLHFYLSGFSIHVAAAWFHILGNTEYDVRAKYLPSIFGSMTGFD